MILSSEKQKWLQELPNKTLNFLALLADKNRKGFYKFSVSGDVVSSRYTWGLANSVFALKILYTIGEERETNPDVTYALQYLQSFQKKNGNFRDVFIEYASLPMRVYRCIYKREGLGALSFTDTIRAQSRQAISSFSMFGEKPRYVYKNFPSTVGAIINFLETLDWSKPWHAGSHVSHILFFIFHNNLKNKNVLIDTVIKWVHKNLWQSDGSWYKNNPTEQEKINGAMKIISGLIVCDRLDTVPDPKKVIDLCLEASAQVHACDNFNIMYCVKQMHVLTKNKYRHDEIKQFARNKLDIYYKFYRSETGGFSFFETGTEKFFYGAYIAKGKDEADIHGTVMFLWGISLIVSVLGLTDTYPFREFKT